MKIKANLEQILNLLKEGSFVSGTFLAQESGITRTAVWKRVNTLKEKGFKIKSSHEGYKLLSTPDFSIEELKTLIKGEIGKELLYFKKTTSTNDLAMELAQSNARHGTIVIADSQLKGRGRLGRKWLSPPGLNIYMSVILKPDIPPKAGTLLTLLSSVSVANAIRRLTDLHIKIKWPNDIMVGDRKLGGILLELRSEPDRILYAVIGIGINVNMEAKNLPPSLRQIATSIFNETGKVFKRTLIIAEILNEMDKELNILNNKGKTELLKKWRLLSSTLGKEVMVTVGKETIRGIAEDIDREGRLILETKDGKKRIISSGDLIYLR